MNLNFGFSRTKDFVEESMYFPKIVKRFNAVLEGYRDAHWISDLDETKTLSGGAISWKLSKQNCTTKSMMEF